MISTSFSKKVCYTIPSCCECGLSVTFLQKRHVCGNCKKISCESCSEKFYQQTRLKCPFCAKQWIDDTTSQNRGANQTSTPSVVPEHSNESQLNCGNLQMPNIDNNCRSGEAPTQSVEDDRVNSHQTSNSNDQQQTNFCELDRTSLRENIIMRQSRLHDSNVGGIEWDDPSRGYLSLQSRTRDDSVRFNSMQFVPSSSRVEEQGIDMRERGAILNDDNTALTSQHGFSTANDDNEVSSKSCSDQEGKKEVKDLNGTFCTENEHSIPIFPPIPQEEDTRDQVYNSLNNPPSSIATEGMTSLHSILLLEGSSDSETAPLDITRQGKQMNLRHSSAQLASEKNVADMKNASQLENSQFSDHGSENVSTDASDTDTKVDFAFHSSPGKTDSLSKNRGMQSLSMREMRKQESFNIPSKLSHSLRITDEHLDATVDLKTKSNWEQSQLQKDLTSAVSQSDGRVNDSQHSESREQVIQSQSLVHPMFGQSLATGSDTGKVLRSQSLVHPMSGQSLATVSDTGKVLQSQSLIHTSMFSQSSATGSDTGKVLQSQSLVHPMSGQSLATGSDTGKVLHSQSLVHPMSGQSLATGSDTRNMLQSQRHGSDTRKTENLFNEHGYDYQLPGNREEFDSRYFGAGNQMSFDGITDLPEEYVDMEKQWRNSSLHAGSFEMQANQPMEFGHSTSIEEQNSDFGHTEIGATNHDVPTEQCELAFDKNSTYYNMQVKTCCNVGCIHYYRNQNLQPINTIARENDHEIKDVMYDGNCMFRALIDQLYFQGDFSYSSFGLRLQAIRYLQQNPKHEDGTHLDSFLLHENWNQYLRRMSQPGEWGDHMMLNAITNVLGRKLVIYSSEVGSGQTTLEPVGGARLDGVLYISHVGQSHFVSMRPKDWRSSWYKQLKGPREERCEFMASDLITGEMATDDFSGVPTPHLNFFLKNVLWKDYFNKPLSYASLSWNSQNGKHEVIGAAIEGLEAELLDLSKTDETSDSFAQNSGPKTGKNTEMWFIPRSMFVVWPDESTGSRRELIAESTTDCGYIKVVSKHWQNEYISFQDKRHSYIPDWRTYDVAGPSVNIALPISTWPSDALEWITRDRRVDWPKQATISSVVSAGCHAVQYAHMNTSDPKHDFLLHFGLAERILSKDISPMQQYCFFVFSALLHFQMKAGTALSDYHLKTVFYYASEEIPSEMWAANTGACLLYLLHKLLECLKQRKLPHYFICKNNLLNYYSETDIQDILIKVEAIRRFPMESIWFLAEAHRLPDTEMLELLLEDFEPYEVDRNLLLTAQEVFLPIVTSNIRSRIVNSEYYEAVLFAKNAYDEFIKFFTLCSFGEFLMSIIVGGPIKAVWWFGLVSDLTFGTLVLKHLDPKQKQDSLRRIIDDRDDNELANIAIPASFLTPNPTVFVIDLGCVLYDMNRLDDSAYCFRGVIRIAKKELGETVKRTIGDSMPDMEKKLNYTRLMTQQMVINNMWMALTWLWHIYSMNGQHSLFVEYMEDAEETCERLGQPKYYATVANIWDKLGNKDKAAQARYHQNEMN